MEELGPAEISLGLEESVEAGVCHPVAVLEGLSAAINFSLKGVEKDISQRWARVISLEEVAELVVQERKHSGASSGVRVEMGLALGVPFTRATSNGLGSIDLLEHRAHR